MSSSNQKPIKRKLFRKICAGLSIVFFIGLCFLYFFLPKYIENKILPIISQKVGIDNLKCDIRRIGFTGIDMGGFRLGKTGAPSVTIESIRLDYSPLGLLRRRVNSIEIAGLEIPCKIENGKYIIPGIDLQAIFAEQKQDGTVLSQETKSFKLPMYVESFKIRSAVLLFRFGGQSYRIPFELSLLAREDYWNLFECTLKLYLREQELTVSSYLRLMDNSAFVNVHFDSFHLDRFADVTNVLAGIVISGDIEANLGFSSSELNIKSEGNFRFALEQIDQKQIDFLRVEKPLCISGNFTAHYKNSGTWKFEISNDNSSKMQDSAISGCKIHISLFDMVSSLPDFTLSGKGSGTKGNIRLVGKLDDLLATHEYATIRVPSIFLDGDAHFDNTVSEGRAFFKIKLPDVHVSSEYFTLNIPSLSIEGKIHDAKENSVPVTAVVNLEGMEALAEEYGIKITGICGVIPFQWPCENAGKEGTLFAQNIGWNNKDFGSVSENVYQKGMGAVFDGVLDSSFIPGLMIHFNGETVYSDTEDFKTEISFHVPRFKLDSIDLADFIPETEGTLFHGELEFGGNVMMGTQGNFDCLINTSVQKATIEIPDQGISLKGIQGSLTITDLFNLRSDPNQQFLFEKASFGEIICNEGKISFQIESPETIFMEKCQFKWCNGFVDTHAARIPLYEKDYDIIFYCNQLQLSMILEQFGLANVEGSGTVNGRIPIQYRNGRISMDKGFLYSMPGKGGRVHIAGTEILDVGMLAGIPQYSQLDFTREALKDFVYDWATLSLETKEEDLFLRLSLFGKPKNPLPFVYKKDIGAFARIEANSKGGIYQPIQCDMNIRLPINKILYYSKGVHGAMDKIK